MFEFDKLRKRKYFLLFIDMLFFITIASVVMLTEEPSAEKIGSALLMLVCVVLFRMYFRVYRQVWRYATAIEFLYIILADFLGGTIFSLINFFILPMCFKLNFWNAVAVIEFSCLASLGARFVYQYIYRYGKTHEENTSYKINLAIMGAGSAGFYAAREMQINSTSHFRPCIFIDNDKEKIGNVISGLRVYPFDGILDVLKEMEITDIVIALPGALGAKKRELFDFYTKNGYKVKLYELPFVQDGASGYKTEYDKSKKPVIREVKLEDLLFRDPIKINDEATGAYYSNKVIMITGGGGSIGSEICRQVAKYSPKKIVIFDIYENSAYDIQQEMKILSAQLNVFVEIASVCNEAALNAAMKKHKPDIVVHAAAHKHVPLMEHNSIEAVRNNIFGTLNVILASEQNDVKKFILISTDKAVNPTNIMGATKRMCEMMVESRLNSSSTAYTAVRFGNVLGSNGSVIPLFRRQIASGGPVTITDKRIVRYFMTIPEAAQLVLESGAMAKNGELFVLDMGKPVKILKLAEDMIRLSGLVPYEDIQIEEIGLRDGEKLYEELLVNNNALERTENELIFIERGGQITHEEINSKLERFRKAVEEGADEAIRAAIKETIPTYRDPELVNQSAAQSIAAQMDEA